MTGKVYFIGAGPGDPGLLTLKGSWLLAEADTVYYPVEISPELLGLARKKAELYAMGAKPSDTGKGMRPYLAEMADRAGQGEKVVVLTEGDPMLYAQGAEAALILRGAGVAFEIVPGVAAALAAPAYAGIPLTHAGLSGTVTVVYLGRRSIETEPGPLRDSAAPSDESPSPRGEADPGEGGGASQKIPEPIPETAETPQVSAGVEPAPPPLRRRDDEATGPFTQEPSSEEKREERPRRTEQRIGRMVVVKKVRRMISDPPLLPGTPIPVALRKSDGVEILDDVAGEREVFRSVEKPLLRGRPVSSTLEETAPLGYPSPDWASLGHLGGTLVVVADQGTLSTAVHKLLKHGRPPEEPAAVILRATTNRQQTVTGRLSTIGSIAEAAGVSGDCLLVVGDTAGFRDRLNWFEERPLFGYRVALTDLEDRAREQARCLEEEGAVVSVVPLLGVAPLPDAKEALLEAAERFHHFDFVVFTSPVTVRIFFEVLWEEGKDPRLLSGPRIVAVFPATAAELGRYSLQPDVLMEELPSRGLASRLGMEEGHRVLLPRPARARDLLPLQLREEGAQVEIIPVYDTIPNEEGMEVLRQLILDGALDLAVYSSSSGFESFWERLDAAERSVCLSQVNHACTGSLVARGLAAKGIKPCFELQDPNPGDLREAVLACRGGGTSEEESVPPPGQPEEHE